MESKISNIQALNEVWINSTLLDSNPKKPISSCVFKSKPSNLVLTPLLKVSQAAKYSLHPLFSSETLSCTFPESVKAKCEVDFTFSACLTGCVDYSYHHITNLAGYFENNTIPLLICPISTGDKVIVSIKGQYFLLKVHSIAVEGFVVENRTVKLQFGSTFTFNLLASLSKTYFNTLYSPLKLSKNIVFDSNFINFLNCIPELKKTILLEKHHILQFSSDLNQSNTNLTYHNAYFPLKQLCFSDLTVIDNYDLASEKTKEQIKALKCTLILVVTNKKSTPTIEHDLKYSPKSQSEQIISKLYSTSNIPEPLLEAVKHLNLCDLAKIF